MSEGMRSEDRLVRIAESIVDGHPVDWAAEDRASEPQGDDVVKHLRMLESVASAHRAPPGSPEDGTVPGLGETRDMAAAGSVETRDASEEPVDGSWGSLALRAKLGQGSFGEVYRAYDRSLDREVALKLMRSDAGRNPDLKRFLSEARRMARVRHPNVLVVHGVDTHEGRVGIWTDLLQGRTLEDYLQQESTIGAREAALIGIDLCHALAAVHQAGVVHRDVKPSNIMRESGGRIVLMDFGSGGDLPPGGGLVRSDHAYGTPLCMAPEQLHGQVAGPPTDLYALGVLLYRAVSGSFPIDASSFGELERKHREGAAVPLRDRRPDLPTDFVRIVDRALQPNPRDRFQSAGEMERALLATVGSTSSETMAAPSKPAKRGRPLVLGIGAVLAVALAVLVLRPRSEHAGNVPAPAATPGTPSGLGTQAPPVAPPTVAVSANAALFRERGGQTERLQGGARVRPGDDVYMTLESPEPVYAYVLNQDERGGVYVLYPVLGLTPANPLPGGVSHRLPGRLFGEEVNWEVTVAGGREEILVLASRTPLSDVEEEIAKFPRARAGAPIQYGQLSERALVKVRGFGGFSKREAARTAGTEGVDRLGQVLRQASTPDARGPWVWQIALESPRTP